MVELKVISHISKQLNDFTTKVFALWNEADPVYNHIIGVGADVRDAYLRQERRKFFQELMASPSYELQIAVETTLDQLRYFWVDANEFYDANDEGNEADPVAWSLIKTYKTEPSATSASYTTTFSSGQNWRLLKSLKTFPVWTGFRSAAIFSELACSLKSASTSTSESTNQNLPRTLSPARQKRPVRKTPLQSLTKP